VQVEARVPNQPPLDGVGLVGAVVVQDEMYVEVLGHLLVDPFQEPAELQRSMLLVELADHLPCRHLQGSEQGGGALPLVVVGLPGGRTGQEKRTRTASGGLR